MFGRMDLLVPSGGYAVQYDEVELSKEIRSIRVPAEEVFKLPSDGLAGHLYLQALLRRYFRNEIGLTDAPGNNKLVRWFRGLPKEGN
jgi:hypothetical protein